MQIGLLTFEKIWVAGIDEVLTPEGIISPGLGDTVSGNLPSDQIPSLIQRFQGDRLFNTIRT